MIKEIRKLVVEASNRAGDKVWSGIESGDTHERDFYQGYIEACRYVFQILDRFSDEKGDK